MSSIAGTSGGAHIAGSNKNSKTRWPEVVGMLAEDAAKVIKRDMPGATIEVMSSDEPAFMDFLPHRVRLFVDTVAKAPTVSITRSFFFMIHTPLIVSQLVSFGYVVDHAELELAGGKSSWPEVVGMSTEEAQEVILSQKPGADIEVVPVGRAVAGDLKANRVRIFVDTVAEAPFVG
ncbi:hypothetical protein HU200_051157 [Digitaria exilis]|uniref:Uncharacterized protein n=1 Tax=Digitaria exilis TaxID=1010633 RepID=A0A835E9U5_9POAL|nr:hypothetical protein HU200_051157 [Digitaria exilis]